MRIIVLEYYRKKRLLEKVSKVRKFKKEELIRQMNNFKFKARTIDGQEN